MGVVGPASQPRARGEHLPRDGSRGELSYAAKPHGGLDLEQIKRSDNLAQSGLYRVQSEFALAVDARKSAF